MIFINITILISYLEKGYSMIEMRRLRNAVIFFQTILDFVLSKIFLNNFKINFLVLRLK